MALVSASFSKLFIHFNVSKYLFLHYFSPLIWFFPVLLLEISILFSSTFYNLPLVNPSKDHIIQGNCMPTISCNTWSFFFFFAARWLRSWSCRTEQDVAIKYLGGILFVNYFVHFSWLAPSKNHPWDTLASCGYTASSWKMKIFDYH